MQASLRAAISRASSINIGEPHEVLEDIETAFVLVFNAGQHDEGVYTLQGRSSHTSAYVLAFERDDDAERFSQLLHTEGFVRAGRFSNSPGGVSMGWRVH